MAVICPANNADPFSEPSKMKLYARRRKDYSKPLVIDCSVEYELPNSAKPPIGNKNEPLLMIHPSYYRREESKRRSPFVNNLPKRRVLSRFTRSALYRGAENSITNHAIKHCILTRQRIYRDDRKSVVNDVQPISRTPASSAIFQTQSNLDNIGLQARTDIQYNYWVPNFHNLPVNNDKYENNIDSKYHNRTQERGKKNFCDNNDSISRHAAKAKPVKKSITYKDVSTIGSAATSASVISSTGATTFQQQPAVGVAAIAATPLNYCSHCPTIVSAAEGNHHSSIRQQPWSATTAPEFPPSSLPMSHLAQKRPLIGIIYPDVSPQLSSARKRIPDSNSWWCDEYSNDDSSLVKRNRLITNENAQTYNPPNLALSYSERCRKCKMACSQEPHELYNNFSNGSTVAGNTAITSGTAWSRTGDNLNMLPLFRF